MYLAVGPKRVIEVFYCYSHQDRTLRDRFEKHLSILRLQGIINEWHDYMIDAGEEREPQINRHLNTAHIILLLVSPDFLASEYCYSGQMKRALERHEAREAYVIPVILRPVLWKGALFGKLQALPRDARAITRWRNRDDAFLSVAEGIQKVIEKLTTSRDSHAIQAEKSGYYDWDEMLPTVSLPQKVSDFTDLLEEMYRVFDE